MFRLSADDAKFLVVALDAALAADPERASTIRLERRGYTHSVSANACGRCGKQLWGRNNAFSALQPQYRGEVYQPRNTTCETIRSEAKVLDAW